MFKNERFLAVQSPVRTGFDVVCTCFVSVLKMFEAIWTCFDGCLMANFNRKVRQGFALSDAKPVASKMLFVWYFLLKDSYKSPSFRLCDLCENLRVCGYFFFRVFISRSKIERYFW